MNTNALAAPPAEFNFAQHLIRLNAGRQDKIALIDDLGQLSYGQMAERIRRTANALRALGLRREERVLLLMHDSNDWITSFLGALYAGIVPVALNTLLTAEDYGYMLRNSRAQAALVSGALLPTLQTALEQGPHEVRHLLVSRPSQPLGPVDGLAVQDLETALAASPAQAEPAQTLADEAAFWLYSSGSTGRPKGTVHTQGNLYWTATLYAQPVLGLTEADTVFSAA